MERERERHRSWEQVNVVASPPKHGTSIFQQALKIFNYLAPEGFAGLMTVANFNGRQETTTGNHNVKRTFVLRLRHDPRCRIVRGTSDTQ